MLRVGLVGCGLWGPNLARNFFSNPRSSLKTVFDIDTERARLVAGRLRGVSVAESFEDILEDEEIDALVVATPLATHYELAKACLASGKSVFLEKPMTSDCRTAMELKALAECHGKVLMTGYVFLFNAALGKAREYIHSGLIGDVHYATATRTNLGPIRSDTSALWDLTSHDVSILLHILGEDVLRVNATGGFFLSNPRADAVSATIHFAGGRMAFLYASWLDPCKVRRITFVGKEKMILFDDMQGSEPLKVFDKGVVRHEGVLDTFGMHQLGIRQGEVRLPLVQAVEPLSEECNAFISACLDGIANPATGNLSLKVTAVLEALQESIDGQGCPVDVEPFMRT